MMMLEDVKTRLVVRNNGFAATIFLFSCTTCCNKLCTSMRNTMTQRTFIIIDHMKIWQTSATTRAETSPGGCLCSRWHTFGPVSDISSESSCVAEAMLRYFEPSSYHTMQPMQLTFRLCSVFVEGVLQSTAMRCM